MLPVIFPLLRDAPAVTAYIGVNPVRFFRFKRAPQKVVAPYVTWFVVTGVPYNTLSELPLADAYNVQIDIWSDNEEECEALAKAVRDTLEPHGHCTALLENDQDPDTRRYRICFGFTFINHRNDASS